MSEKIEIDALKFDLKKLKAIGRLLSDKERSVDYRLDECGGEITRISNSFENLLEFLVEVSNDIKDTRLISPVVPFPTDTYLILSGKLLYSIRYHFTLLRDLREVIDDKLYLKICDRSSQYSDFKIGSRLTSAIDEILENDIDDDVHDFLQSMVEFNDSITSIYEQILNGKPITGEYGHQEYDHLTETDLTKYIEYVNEKATKIKCIPRV